MLGMRCAAPLRASVGSSFGALSSLLTTSRVAPAVPAASTVAAVPARTYLGLISGPMTLGNLADVPGARKIAKRLGRGRASGLGKTSGRGQKGQGARSGLRSLTRYEGGQTMLWRRSPKHGFKNINRKELDVVNVDNLVKFISAGRIDASKTITMKHLVDSGLVSSVRHGIKLCGRDASMVARLPVPINIEVTHSTALARDAIQVR